MTSQTHLLIQKKRVKKTTRNKCDNSDSNNDDSVVTENTTHEIDVDHFIRAKKVTK